MKWGDFLSEPSCNTIQELNDILQFISIIDYKIHNIAGKGMEQYDTVTATKEKRTTMLSNYKLNKKKVQINIGIGRTLLPKWLLKLDESVFNRLLK